VTALKTVYEPEIPADIYEIGLIYRIDIADDRTVKVDMSLTSPNCPSAEELPVMVIIYGQQRETRCPEIKWDSASYLRQHHA
jgi:metal-sulfur cluster biosynthetic enzyme